MTSVADAIAGRVRDEGIRCVFGVPEGGTSLDAIDAAARAGVRFVLTSTETAAALAAIGYAEASGVPGVCLAGLGPGVASIVNGVACARLDRAPLVVITDAHPPGPFTHQRLDQRALLAPLVKWSATLDAESAATTIERALSVAKTPPAGPVHLDWPSSGGSASDSVAALPEAATAFELPTNVRERLAAARRPLLLVGMGARGEFDAEAVRSFCREHRVPALVTYKAKGVVSDDDPMFAGLLTNGAVERAIVDQSDLLIGAGLDPIELLPRPWTFAQPFVNCVPWTIESAQIDFCAQLVGPVAPNLARLNIRRSEWNPATVAAAAHACREAAASTGKELTPSTVVSAVADAFGDARVTVDAGAHMFPATALWPVREPNGMLISNGLSTMAFAVPAAIGAALAEPSRRVVALTGDGGLLMCAGELLTMARERLAITVVVLNDASLSLIAIKQAQRNEPPAGVRLGNADWCAVAEGFGLAAFRARTDGELADALRRARSIAGPAVIDVHVDPSGYGDMLRRVRG